MNVLFILGNGFDLNLGLKTGYDDFYEFFIDKYKDSKDKNIISFKKSIQEYLDTKKEEKHDFKMNWSDLELALGEFTQNYNSDEEFERLLDIIIFELETYLRSIEDSIEKKGQTIDKGKFIQDLLEPEKYLTPAEKNIFIKFKNNFKHDDWNFDIVTLNYTNIVEQIVNSKLPFQIGNLRTHDGLKTRKLNSLNHVHGMNGERMILGVNDVEQIKNTEFHSKENILEAFVKSNCNQANGELFDKQFEKQIENANLICTFGLSFGITDKIWWEKINKRLETVTIFLIMFDIADISEDDAKRRPNKLLRYQRSTKNKLLIHSKLNNENKALIEDRIFVAINSRMFKDILIEKPVTIPVNVQ